jgi:adhesin transport system outer membrane protein
MIKIAILFTSFFLALKALAADFPIITIDQLLAKSMEHPSVSQKKKEQLGAEQKLSSAKWGRFPAVSVLSSASQSSIISNNAAVVTTLRVDQPIWAGGRISNSIDAAGARASSFEFVVIETQQDMAIKASSAFANYLKLKQKIEASQESIAEHQRLLEMIERKARNEVSPMSEIILAKVRLNQAKSENIAFQTQLANFKGDIQNYLGASFDDLQTPRILFSIPGSVNESLKLALDYSPTLKRLTLEKEAAGYDAQISKSALFPQLSVRSDQSYGGVVEGNTTYMAFTYTPGNGLSALSNAREAEARQDALDNSMSSVKLDLTNKINTFWNQYKAETSQIEVLSNLSETSKGVFMSYVRQYDAGKKTWVEVLNARKEATLAKYQLAESQWNAFIAGINLEIYTGMVNPSSLDLK